jgi:adenine/guanine/hypoxanthine permease
MSESSETIRTSVSALFNNKTISEEEEDEKEVDEKETEKESTNINQSPSSCPPVEKGRRYSAKNQTVQKRNLLTLLDDKLSPYYPDWLHPPTLTLPTFLQHWVDLAESFFECQTHGSSVGIEIFAGIVNFFSCMYCLPVIPEQMHAAGYTEEAAFAAICFVGGLGTIASGFLTNTPLIVAPPTAVSIFLCSGLQSEGLSPLDGNAAVVISGIAMFIIGIFAPIGRVITRLIPSCIQAGTTVGIGLLTAFAGAHEVHLIVEGEYTLLKIGRITNEVLIALSGLVILGALVIHHSKIAYVVALAWGTVIWWTQQNIWPKTWLALPTFESDHLHEADQATLILAFSLIFLNILTLFGLAAALCSLAGLIQRDGSIPRGRFLVLVIGVCNIFSGILYGPPMILSPEAVGGIKAGARTGLSAIVCGTLFFFAIFWGPFFTAIPPAGTSPLLIIVGMQLFMNIQRIDFHEPKYGIPGFCCLFFIPFTNSIICGVGVGYAMYILLNIFTLDFFHEFALWWERYFPVLEEEHKPSEPPQDLPNEKEESKGQESLAPSTGTESPTLSDPASPTSTLKRRNSGANTPSSPSSPAGLNLSSVSKHARRVSVAFMNSVATDTGAKGAIEPLVSRDLD